MFGNRMGWIISSVMAVGMAALLLKLSLPPSPTEPINSPKLAVALKPILLAVSPDKVVPAGQIDGDAGKFYRDAIDAVKKTPRIYEDFLHNHDKFESEHGKEVPEVRLEAVGLILKARDCKTCNLFRNDPTELTNYANAHEDLDSLEIAGNACIILGMHIRDKQPEKSVKLWEAGFELGIHLYDERITSKEQEVGYVLSKEAATQLQKFYEKKKDSRGGVLKEFIDEESSYQKKLSSAYQLLGMIDESQGTMDDKRPLGDYAGDILKIAQSPDADPMFRVEAILHIGRYHYNPPTVGDQIAGRRLLKKMADDATLPPSVKAAAKVGRDLTTEDFHKIGGAS